MRSQQETLTSTPKKRRYLGPCALVFRSANTGSWRLERPVVDAEACVKCGTCARSCPTDCITVDKDAAVPVTFDWYYCKGCGLCANECPKKCIRLVDEREASNV